jgi:GT2 family glycosyltransferase
MELAVVIAAWNGPESLERCLASLAEEIDTGEIEVIVASNYASEAEGMIRAQYPSVSLVALPREATVPELRARGVARASGAIVALLEDHAVCAPGWAEAMRRAHRSPWAAVGGAVENASRSRRIDWAVYFYDYGAYMPPGLAGETAVLTGLNVSYKREALEAVGDEIRDGFFETRVHAALRDLGYRLYFEPGALVFHDKSHALVGAIRQAFHFGRSFAAMRVATAPATVRAALALGTPLLPVLLLARIASHTMRNGRHRRELLGCLPHLVALVAGWSAGELCGYAAGDGGSTARWR